VPTTTRPTPRPWYQDALSAFAFACLAVTLGKGARNLFGPFGGLFVFALCGGLAWFFGRAAWRGLTAAREANRR
jgi:hypothetical protein